MRKLRKVEKKGYAILELLFYVAFFSVLTLTVVSALLSMSKTFKETSRQAEILRGSAILERISSEIRQASAIDSISTTNLQLNQDNAGVISIAEFSLAGTDLEFRRDGGLVGDLNPPNLLVSALNFTQITTAAGQAVKRSMTSSATSKLAATRCTSSGVIACTRCR